MPTLTTLAKLKIHLGITGTDDDTQLTQFLNELDAVVLHYTGRRSFESASRTEYYSGSGSTALFLNYRPLTDITSVYVDPSGYGGKGTNPFPSTTLWTEGTDYVAISETADLHNVSQVESIAKVWTKGLLNIKITYTAGYATIPIDLELAVHQLASVLYKASEDGIAGPIGSETFGSYSYSVLAGATTISSSGSELAYARKILARYKVLS